MAENSGAPVGKPPPQGAPPLELPGALAEVLKRLPAQYREGYEDYFRETGGPTAFGSEVVDAHAKSVSRTLAATQAARAERERLQAAMAPRPVVPEDAGITHASTPFTTEVGAHKAGEQVIPPLMGRSGGYTANPKQSAYRISQLEIANRLKQSEYKNLADVPHDVFIQWKQEADDKAKRFIAGQTGSSEQRGNMIVPLDPEKQVDEIRKGDLSGVAKLAYATPVGAIAVGSNLARSLGFVGEDEQTRAEAFAAPFFAMAAPGSGAFDAQTGEKVEDIRREGGFWWFLRVAPSTAVGSWLLDPETTWELGGEKGWGGERHIKKITGGYDVLSDIHRLGDMWDGVTPWESGKAEKLIAGGVPLAAVVLMEPDLASLATLGVGAALSKPAKLVSAGTKVLEEVYEPALKSWQKASEGGASIEDVARLAGPEGSHERDVFKAVYAETRNRIATEAAPKDGTVGSVLSNLDPVAARNIDEVKAGTTEQAAEALVRRGEAEDIVKELEAKLDAAGDDRLVAYKHARLAVDNLEVEAAIAKREHLAAAERYAASSRLDELASGEIKVGDKVRMTAARAGREEYEVVGLKKSRGKTRVQIKVDGALKTVDSASVKLAPRAFRSAAEILQHMQEFKKSRPALMKALAEASERGDTKLASALRKQLRHEGLQLASDVADLQHIALRRAVYKAERDMEAVKAQLSKAHDKVKSILSSSPREMRQLTDRLNAAKAQLSAATEVAAVQAQRAKAAARAEAIFRETLKDWTDSVSEAASKQRGISTGAVGVSTTRAEVALATLAHSKMAEGWSRESWHVWAYQMASRLSHRGDLVGKSIVGKMPRAVQEVVRRSYERFAGAERDLAKIWGTGGQSVDDFITGTAQVADGVFSNQDTISIADKALDYLRNLPDEAWEQDVIVKAIRSAPTPPWYAGTTGAAAVGKNLKSALKDPGMDGVKLWKWLSDAAPSIFAAAVGKSDSAQVTRRFMARAIIQASNQYDAMHDMYRLLGPRLGKDASDAANWFIDPVKLSRPVSLDEALSTMAELKMPQLSTTVEPAIMFTKPTRTDELGSFFTARKSSNKLMQVGIVAGQDFYIPNQVWRALQDVPRTLSKELVEFSEKGSRFWETLDQLARLWRVSAVYGYFLPRPQHFVNTFFGDWSQMVTVLGWKEGTKQAITSAPTYIPFVGARLQKAIGSRVSVLHDMLDQDLAKAMSGSRDVTIATKEGPIDSVTFMREAIEDGVMEGHATRDLIEIAGRSVKKWSPLEVPAHIEATARFMESIQSRARLRVYLRARTGKSGKALSRLEARDQMVRTLYDWNTGISDRERSLAGRISAFWTYRRMMVRQAAGALTEGITDPSLQYAAKAATGNTELARMRQFGLIAASVPDALYWPDSEQYIDDEEGLHQLGMKMSPWWARNRWSLGNRKLSESKAEWVSSVTGKKHSYEALMMPSLTTLDQLQLYDLMAQNAAAAAVAAAEAAGLKPSITTADADQIAERNISAFADMMMPVFDDAVRGALEEIAGVEGPSSSKGVPVPQAQALLLKRLHWDEFMAAEPNADGTIMMDKTAYGLATALVLGSPWVNDAARGWRIFDNPAMQESFASGIAESAANLLGIAKPYSFDPFKSYTTEAKGDASRIKSEIKKLESKITPTR